MQKIMLLLVMLGLCVASRNAAHATVKLTPVLTGLSAPVLATHAGDGSRRLFVVEQVGRVDVLQPGATTATTFLNISAKVGNGSEQGLLGLAFHPHFKSNRRFFVDYTRKSDGATIIAEYSASVANPNIASATEKILLTVPQPFANHNGGMLAFGPDGFLYIGLGDGGSANDPDNRAQNINELLGKILRIDVNAAPATGLQYAIPADNPFAGATAGRDEIYALGLRNPWRFSFDRQNGALWAGDVGQDAWEEVDLITRGGNYGWRTREGKHCTGLNTACDSPAFTEPIFEYAHDSGRCSITGGYVYRGSKTAFPGGAYIFGDFCSGEIFQLRNGQFSVIGSAGDSVTSFGEDQDGEIYVCTYGGAVSKIEADGLRISDVRISEGQSSTANATFTVALSLPAMQSVTVNYVTVDGTAKAGSDYLARSGTLTFAPGQISKTINVPVEGDTLVETDENFYVDLKTPSGATIADSRGVATILNDDGPQIFIDNAKTVNEGNSGTTLQSFAVRLSAASTAAVTVDWATANGTANAADYTVASGTLTFAPGQVSKLIVVQVKGDTLIEPTETYRVNLSHPTFAVIADSQGVGYIRNDDAALLFESDEAPSR